MIGLKKITVTGTLPSGFRLRPRDGGAALIVTLGVLSLLAVLAVAFLASSRSLRRIALNQRHAQTARDQMPQALWLAVRQLEEGLVVSNASLGEVASPVPGRRVAPVGQWFSPDYLRDRYGVHSDRYTFWHGAVMTSPGSNDVVNLLTPEVLRMIPAALTNGLPLDASEEAYPLRSAWSWIDPEAGELNPLRFAFAVVDLSGCADANYYASGAVSQRLARVCHAQADVTNWFNRVFAETNDVPGIAEERCPFTCFSYDPDPDTVPLAFPSNHVRAALGTHAFHSGTLHKFNLNSVTNLASWKVVRYGNGNGKDETPWYNDSEFKAKWLDFVNVYVSGMAKAGALENDDYQMPEGVAIPYSIVNELDGDRIPQISSFTAEVVEGEQTTGQALATRVDYAVEAVPLINKVSVFPLYAPEGGKPSENLPPDVDFDFYELDASLSNHYAVAVEYWYPFAPVSPYRDGQGNELNFAAYVGIYTNSDDIATTTNMGWNASLLRDWFRWNDPGSSNTVMQTLFRAWKESYLSAVGSSVYANPLWLAATFQQELWFTPAMPTHPYWPDVGTNSVYSPYVEQFFTPLGLEQWPVVDTNGAFNIEQTPVWLAFHPAVTNIVEEETNLVWVVTESNEVAYVDGEQETTVFEPTESNQVVQVALVTNVYTYLTVTNPVITWQPDAETSYRLLYAQSPDYRHDRTWMLWETGDGGFLTNDVVSLTTLANETIPFTSTNQFAEFWIDPTNRILFTVRAVGHPVTNEDETVTLEYEMVTNVVTALTVCESGTTNTWTLTRDNVAMGLEVQRVKPLPMPGELGVALDELLYLLPTNSTSELYTYLTATPFDDDFDWDRLHRSFSHFPNILNKMFPTIQEPTLGDLDESNRYYLKEGDENGNSKGGRVVHDLERVQPGRDFQGYFWTVYPKQTVNFMEVEFSEVPGENGVTEQQPVTNYYALGEIRHGEVNRIWVRPVTTVRPDGSEYEQDQIVDEALLTHENPPKVIPFNVVTNLYAPDPRRNMWGEDNWAAFPDGLEWKGENIRSTNLTEVAELPFIHHDKPFTRIGEIGDVYGSFLRKTREDEAEKTRYDTINFATRAGAALLDLFTVHPTPAPWRGLVQANTENEDVVRLMLNGIPFGWTNIANGASTEGVSFLKAKPLDNWAEVYLEALTNDQTYVGWRCFADMMPPLLTNRLANAARQKNPWEDETAELHPLHDYDEEIVSSLADKVSFRQSLYLVILSVQTLGPASTEERPVVLGESRAAVTIVRDAFTGRWTVVGWRVL
ncbi:MAG: hypothetical protein J6Z49_06740 [Kiritimatiellae bacterium]|nr:hypothetical protein [Kiritimatiellia bacterium]